MVRQELASVASCVMNTNPDLRDDTSSPAVTISFGERFAASDQFDAIFKEGMALVERTASYLDGPGRKEARLLRGPVSVLYATESMRLTTRLLELASWLMIRRALKAGEISAEEARVKRDRVRLRAPGRPSHVKGFSELPGGAAQPHRGELRPQRPHRAARSRHAGGGGRAASDRLQSGRSAGAAHRGSLRQPTPPPRRQRAVVCARCDLLAAHTRRPASRRPNSG